MSLIKIEKAFFRPLATGHVNQTKNIFKHPISLSIGQNERWAVTGPKKTELLRVLGAKYIAEPPLALSYPSLGKDFWPSQITQMVEFGSTPIQASHLSARYESYREDTDLSLNTFLLKSGASQDQVDRALSQFLLKGLENRWVVGLSNGQNRRARLALALLKDPKILLVDELFLGLDPSARQKVASVLEKVPPNPHVILGLREQDEFPSWITHVAVTDNNGISHQGTIDEIRPELDRLVEQSIAKAKESEQRLKQATIAARSQTSADQPVAIELDNVTVAYRGEVIFENLKFKARKGEKWHIQGPNGSGKSTLLSLLTADHPQSWNSKIILFGEPRQTGKQSYFGINEKIGHCSPEIHALFPVHKRTVRQAILSGFQIGSFISIKNPTDDQLSRVDKLLADFPDIDPEATVGDLDLSDQKVVMFLRALAREPEILILDEAFSGMSETEIEKCKGIVASYQGTTLVVGHLENEVPVCDKFLRFNPNNGTVEQGNL